MPIASVPLRPSQQSHRLGTAAAVGLLGLALAGHVAATIARPDLRWEMADLQVYREAVVAAFQGLPVYDLSFTGANLPWLYPPFALLVLAPLGWLPPTVAKVVMSLLSLAALGLLSCRSWQATGVVGRRLLLLTLMTTAVLLVSEPMQQNLIMGQINVLLAVLMLSDVLLPRGAKTKGIWIGLAAGLKLTPGLVAVYYLFRRDWVSARNAAVSFVASVVVAAMVLPELSWQYWSGRWLAIRIGPGHLGNQSLLGVLLRLAGALGVGETAVRTLWLVLAAVLGVGATWVLAHRQVDRLGVHCGLAAIALLVSPLSWTPHWILLTPLVVWTAVRRVSPAGVIGAMVAAGLLLFAWPVDGVWSGLVWQVYPADYWPGAPPLLRGLAWGVLGSLYPVLGIMGLGWVVRSGRTSPAAAAKDAQQPPAD